MDEACEPSKVITVEFELKVDTLSNRVITAVEVEADRSVGSKDDNKTVLDRLRNVDGEDKITPAMLGEEDIVPGET